MQPTVAMIKVKLYAIIGARWWAMAVGVACGSRLDPWCTLLPTYVARYYKTTSLACLATRQVACNFVCCTQIMFHFWNPLLSPPTLSLLIYVLLTDYPPPLQIGIYLVYFFIFTYIFYFIVFFFFNFNNCFGFYFVDLASEQKSNGARLITLNMFTMQFN